MEIGDRRVRERDQEGLRVARVGVTRVRSDLRQIGGHRGDRRSASARERPIGVEGGSGWGDSGTSRLAADRWALWRSAIGECERETKKG